MGHLSFMKEEYRRLQGRLMRSAVGMPVPDDSEAREAMYDILRILFSPEDAELASVMPLAPAPAKEIARLADRPLAEVTNQLESMSDRGLLLDVVEPETEKLYYVLPPPVVGFFEFSMMRRREDIPQKKLAEAMERYIHDPAFYYEVTGETTLGRTLVHETAIPQELETEVLSYERASEVIRESTAHAVSLCYCRHKAEHLGHSCDTPQDICMSLNAGAEWVIRRGHGRKADAAEHLDILDRSREMGLVQMGDNVQRSPTFMCNCCGCCCVVMTGLNTYGADGIIKTSNYIADFETETCKGCSRCARACPVHAISMRAIPTDGERRRAMMPEIDESVCLGCGVCVDVCRTGSMTLRARSQRVLTPETTVARVLSQAIENGRLQNFLYEAAAMPAVIRRVLAVLVGLAPAKRLLASEQVKSRFLREAIKRAGVVDI